MGVEDARGHSISHPAAQEVGCEGGASPYFTYGVIDAATKGCILRAAGETRRHKNPHSVPHEQLVPTAGLHCPAGREAVDRTEAGFRQHVLVFTGAEHDIVLASGPGDQSVRERNATAAGAERGAQLRSCAVCVSPAVRGVQLFWRCVQHVCTF